MIDFRLKCDMFLFLLEAFIFVHCFLSVVLLKTYV